MSSAEKIRRLFAKSEVIVSSKIDDRIFSDALTAIDNFEKAEPFSAEPNVWRMIMKSRITRFATAAVIIIVALIGRNHFGSSIVGSSVA